MSRDHVNVTVKEMNPHVYKSENTNIIINSLHHLKI